MALTILNKVLFENEDETYTSAPIDVRQYKAFAILVTYDEGADETAHLEAACLEAGPYVLVADSEQDLGTGSGGVGWDVTSQFPFYKIVVGDGGDGTEGATGHLNVKEDN
jgi:hypothetical protein